MDKYQEVIQANIELHTRLSSDYNTCEPHFRNENIEKVDARLKEAINQAGTQRLLDLGCGTGFMINIAKKYVKEIIGVDVTQAMMDKVDKSGSAKITLINHDTGSVKLENESFNVVTGYSFLHHLYDIVPTIQTAYSALKKGGILYCDLDPNYYFWEKINSLERNGQYDPIVKREIEMVTYKDEDIQSQFGVNKDVFNSAEYGKNIAGGFKEEELRNVLKKVGFSAVEIFYYWYIGQGQLINNESFEKEERFKYAEVMNNQLQHILPLSRHLFKYLGFYAVK